LQILEISSVENRIGASFRLAMDGEQPKRRPGMDTKKPWDMRSERGLAGFHTNVTELKYLPSGRETGNGGTQWIGQQG
jgi:hypothetical protein